jgi:hypothetical protein
MCGTRLMISSWTGNKTSRIYSAQNSKEEMGTAPE